MSQLENIESIEKRLWKSADTLRANSNFASNEYMMPVMGLIFLRHAFNRYKTVKPEIEASLPSRGGKKRPLEKEDFTKRGAVFLTEKSTFDYLENLPGDKDIGQAIHDAMKLIEDDYEEIAGVLPKKDYKEIDNDILRQLIREFSSNEIKKADGDILGRIYEYFLTGFAGQGAHDGGEFFTPVSLVQTIVNVIEPDHGKIIDPACGSGGMFVQSAHFVEKLKKNPNELLTFFGMEKNPTTIRLAQMNLLVHGLTGKISKAISYYEDPYDLVGKADFVMANPPFNVDEVDADKIAKDKKRLPFGLPGVNKEKKVSNGNYLWISYFYSYLKNNAGRAGFVMSSQASSSGGDEGKVRRKLIETGAVDGMMAIRGNFFYTRTVPCELWFLDKGKQKKYHDKVLMVDARNIYRKVTKKVFDFTPEQTKNISSIFWLYRGETNKFLNLVSEHMENSIKELAGVPTIVETFLGHSGELIGHIKIYIDSLKTENRHISLWIELNDSVEKINKFQKNLPKLISSISDTWGKVKIDSASQIKFRESHDAFFEQLRDFSKNIEHFHKTSNKLVDLLEQMLGAKDSPKYDKQSINRCRKSLDEIRQISVHQIRQSIYFMKQAHWLQERFPEAKLRDFEGLVKLVNHKELEENGWSLSPGRYVGVAAEVEDPDFDFEGTIENIKDRLEELFLESKKIEKKIISSIEDMI